MDIKGSGVIHPRCPANIVEIILMETEQINIDNNKLEAIIIGFPPSSSINSHHWKPSEKNKYHNIIEKENSGISQTDHGIIKIVNKKETGIIRRGMVGTIVLDNHNIKI